ncbi:hypothetical protein BDR22DRAFT_283047 [Usnea florida]
MCLATWQPSSCGHQTLKDITQCEFIDFFHNVSLDDDKCKLWTTHSGYTPALRVLTHRGMTAHPPPHPCLDLLDRELAETPRCGRSPILQPNASLTRYALELCMKPSSSVNDIEKYRADQEKKVHEFEEIKNQAKANYFVMRDKFLAVEQGHFKREELRQTIQALKELNGELKKYLPKEKLAKKGVLARITANLSLFWKRRPDGGE